MARLGLLLPLSGLAIAYFLVLRAQAESPAAAEFFEKELRPLLGETRDPHRCLVPKQSLEMQGSEAELRSRHSA